ncbi:hypothetical protein ACZ90_69795 [Streptomyces albus subsp. albus]|nr:hypothetical protein ACZ90_69795 [Streptomyces albus subsp. albus]
MSESVEPTGAGDPGEESCCPGPHQLCRGCTGTRLVATSALYVSRSGSVSEMASLTACHACVGRGFFCRHAPVCRGPHDSGTPTISAHLTPPA